MLLEFVDVAKVYKGGLRGVDGVSMQLGAGLVGLLGPNGAGKSSLMRIAATVTRPTSGQVLFDGTDIVARPDLLRRHLGYLPQDFGVYPHLSAAEFLSYLAAVKGMPARAARARIGELLELVDLAGAGRRAAPRLADIRCSAGNATARIPVAGHRYHVVVTSGTGTAHSKVPDDPQSSSVVQVSSANGNATVLPASQRQMDRTGGQ